MINDKRIKFNYSKEWYEEQYHTNDYKLDKKSYTDLENEWYRYKIRFNNIIDKMDKTVNFNGKSILEIGCHHGKTGFWLAEKYKDLNVDMFDFSSVAVNWCTKNNPYPKKCKIWEQDVSDLGKIDKYYDIITCLDFMEHIPREKYYKMLCDLPKILKKGGYLILKCGTNDKEESHINIIPVGQIIKDLNEFGFKKLDILEDNILIFKLEYVNESKMFTKNIKDFSRCALEPRYPEKYLNYLMEELIRPRKMLEIGTFNGVTTTYFATFKHLMEIVTIDISDRQPERIWKKFNVEDKIVKVVVKDNNQKKEMIDAYSEGFDLVFIDGDHSYEGVKYDFELVKDKAKYILFHDYGTNPYVTKFINELGSKIIHKKIDVGFALWKR